ncbi:MAG: glycosyltransferase [Alphaproteobacteria bacterium]|nr:glycosyltransferase [Alphaproteobacteria bacterium]
MSGPRISVIIPYYKAAAFVENAVASIRRQNYTNLEIILIDDGSEDDVAARVKGWGDDIVFLQQPNKGPAAARNLGIQKATGEIIAFLDADDLWPDDKLAVQLPKLEQDGELGIVTGRVQYVRLAGAEDRELPFDENNTIVHVHLGATLVRREVFERTGLFNEGLRMSEDMDWFLRVRENQVKTVILPETVLIYQMHAFNMTRQLTVKNARMIEVLKASLNRRRAAQGEAKDLGSFSEYGGAAKLDVSRFIRKSGN